jgi:chemotaxis protein histidine kinase CheA
MKAFFSLVVAVFLTVPLTAQMAPKPKAKPKAAVVTTEDLKALRDALAAQSSALAAQQQQIQELKQELEKRDQVWQQAQQQLQQTQTTAADAQSKAAAVEIVASDERVSVAKLSTDVADVKTNLAKSAASAQDSQKRVSALEGIAGRFRFAGDVRVRDDSIFQDCATCIDRNRARLRVRFGVDGKLSEDFVGGFYLVTGSLGDSNSTNETLTNFFERKTIGLDRGYITYQPVAHRWLQVTGGKFGYTWQRTSVTFDPDINPEGFSERFSFDLNTPVIKNFTVQGIQMLYNENNNAKFLTGHDSFAAGGQVSGKLDFGFMTSTPSFTILNWRNVDAILNASAFAVQATTTGTGTTNNGNVPGEGPGCASGLNLPSFPPCVYGPQGFTNATTTDASGRHFLSQFLYADFILSNQIKTGIDRLPLNLLLEYENNLNAADHPLDAKGNLTNLGKQSHGYLADISLGQLRNRNDVQFGYSFEREEQDAIISSFSDSEQRAPTNILQHRVYGLWKVRPNTTAAFTMWIGRTLNSNLEHAIVAPGTTAGIIEPWLKRLQFDLIYSF